MSGRKVPDEKNFRNREDLRVNERYFVEINQVFSRIDAIFLAFSRLCVFPRAFLRPCVEYSKVLTIFDEGEAKKAEIMNWKRRNQETK